jgi:hypothetical protein
MLQRSLPIAHPRNLMSLQLQTLLQKQSQGSIIFDNQYLHVLQLLKTPPRCLPVEVM